jgi:hypothetical protein
MNMNRRDVLATGGASGTLWGAGVGTAHAQVNPPASALDAASLAIVRVWVPVILGDSALPTDPTARQATINLVAQRAGELVSNYHPYNQASVLGLFNTLKQGPQIFNPAFPATWEAMPAATLSALLNAFRLSAAASQRSIYSAFMGIIPNAHYSNPINWPAINYPGPPSIK